MRRMGNPMEMAWGQLINGAWRKVGRNIADHLAGHSVDLPGRVCPEEQIGPELDQLIHRGLGHTRRRDGRFRIGTVAEVMTSETLSELYQADIQVIQVGNRYVVVGEHLDHSGHTLGHTHD